MLLGWGTTFRELKVLSENRFFFVNGNLACGLSLLDRPGLGVSNGAGFFLRNFGLALCSGRILVLCAGVQVLCAGVKVLCAGIQVLCAGVKVLCAGVQVLCAGVQVLCDGIQVSCSGSKV